jgi:hypothetical protein
MADIGFQGSTFAIGAQSITPLTKFDYQDNPATAPITGAGDATEKVATGMHKETVQVDFVGSKIGTVNVGTSGAATAALNDGTTPTANFGTSLVTKLRVSGRLGGTITGSLTIRPSA